MYAPLPTGTFGTIIADPAWQLKTWSAKGQGKSPSKHYQTMSLDDIKAMPVQEHASPDGSLLVLWVPNNMIDQGLEVVASWGFQYSTSGHWLKLSHTGKKLHFGTGYRLRECTETFLIATRGRVPRGSMRERGVIIAPARESGRKPDEQYRLAEALGPGPYLELFSRTTCPGWTVWGDEAGMFEYAPGGVTAPFLGALGGRA